jgi:hypothetical protein
MRPLMLALLFVLTSILTTFTQEDPFLGKWDITATTPQGPRAYWLELRQENGVVAGYFLNRTGSVLKLPQVEITSGELTFSPLSPTNRPKPIFKAKVVGNRLVGTMTSGSDSVNWAGVRPPKWGEHDANATHEFGKPIELFDGYTLANWTVEQKDKPTKWSVADGAMVNDPPANNLVSMRKFKDFKVHAEYKLSHDSNSGLYLRGRYELQILDDYGKPADIHSHMSIYSRVKPAVNASLPAGEWQTVDAVIVGNRVTAVLNGKTVQDNTVIDGITGGALDSDEGNPGPIMLQGDHSKVWFRKVTVTPIVK